MKIISIFHFEKYPHRTRAKTKSSYVPIGRETKETAWTTVFTERPNNGQGTFRVNGKYIVGTFKCQDPLGVEEGQISVGEDLLEVVHLMVQSVYVDAESRLPDALRNLVTSLQMLRNANDHR